LTISVVVIANGDQNPSGNCTEISQKVPILPSLNGFQVQAFFAAIFWFKQRV
jgi:hypothetical protein